MKKIGILTFHYSTNYGGVLQAFALQEVLRKLGHDVEVINLRPKEYHQKSISLTLIARTVLKAPLKIPELVRKIFIKKLNNGKTFAKFENFRQQHMVETELFNRESLSETFLDKFDYIVVGSDQVWNNYESLHKQYFLDYSTKAKKVSYAADSTDSTIVASMESKVQRCLNDFYAISVRNKHSYDFVHKATGLDSPVTVDPTLLHNFNSLDLKEINKEYIFAYILGDEINGGHNQVIDKIKAVHGNVPIYLAQISNMDFKLSFFADDTFYDLSPKQWLEYIKNAKFVYTDSYHGVLFSLKFNKPFVAYYRDPQRAPRFIDLIERYNLKDFIVENANDIVIKESIDFNKIHEDITLHCNESYDFIKRTLI